MERREGERKVSNHGYRQHGFEGGRERGRERREGGSSLEPAKAAAATKPETDKRRACRNMGP